MTRDFKYIGLVILIAAIQPMVLTAQTHVSGIVRDKQSGELLIGASVYDPIKLSGTSTDNNGYFNLVVDRGSDSLIFTYVGYTSMAIPLYQSNDTILNVALLPGSNLYLLHLTD